MSGPSTSVFPSDLTISDLNSIMVLSEGKERNQVGFSILDMENQLIVYLNQIVDNFWFSNVIKKVLMFHINVIIIPDMLLNKLSMPKLLQILTERFPKVPIVKQNFRSFDIRKGIDQVKKLCIVEYLDKILAVSEEKPYAFASFAALIDYIISNIGSSFVPKTLKVEFLENFGKMSIDIDTALRLELVQPASSTLSSSKEALSLFKVMNTCVTNMGKRTLRALILEPMNDIALINDRQRCVEELVEGGNMIHNIKVELNKFQDVHKLMKLSYVMATASPAKVSEAMINLIVLLKNTLQDLPALRDSLQHCRSPFIQYLRVGLSNEKFAQILIEIEKILQPEAQSAHRSRAAFARLFAVKTGVNEFMDVLRQHFSKYIDEIKDHVAEIATQSNLPLRMNHTIQKGFHIQLFLTKEIRNPIIPDGLEVIFKTSKCITMTDGKLYDLNSKISKIVSEVDIMSNGIISELYANIRSDIHIIYLLIDFITELDVLLALGSFSKSVGTVKPVFSNHTEVIDAVHPLLECCWKPHEIVPNSFSSNSDYNFYIITGNNMAGKTVYIKMIATLQILAQLGCYVPARAAQFRLCDKIMSRIGFEDNIEQSASSFTIEMREIEFILRNVTPNSLIIVDELCRSTNIQEAQVLSWCFCEKLLKFMGFVTEKDETNTSENVSDASEMKLSEITAPFVYITTHFEHLLKLTDKFMNVTNLILTDNYKATHYKSNLRENYKQLKLVKAIKFPESVIQHAEQLLSIPGLISETPQFAAFTQRSAFPESVNPDRSTISSILSCFPGNPKHLYELYSMVAQEARNTNEEENREQRCDALKTQLINQIEKIFSSLSDSSNFFINNDN